MHISSYYKSDLTHQHTHTQRKETKKDYSHSLNELSTSEVARGKMSLWCKIHTSMTFCTTVSSPRISELVRLGIDDDDVDDDDEFGANGAIVSESDGGNGRDWKK